MYLSHSILISPCWSTSLIWRYTCATPHHQPRNTLPTHKKIAFCAKIIGNAVNLASKQYSAPTQYGRNLFMPLFCFGNNAKHGGNISEKIFIIR